MRDSCLDERGHGAHLAQWLVGVCAGAIRGCDGVAIMQDVDSEGH
jgi:hypothetical protein